MGKCRELYRNIDAKVGDAERLDYPDESFDCVYCFHSTWYFPNLKKAIDEMLRVVNKGGLMLFDIQNRNNDRIENNYRRQVFLNTTLIGKTIRRGVYVFKKIWSNPTLIFIVHSVPTYPESVYEQLANSSVTNFQVLVKNADESIEPRNEVSAFKEFERLIFAVRK